MIFFGELLAQQAVKQVRSRFLAECMRVVRLVVFIQVEEVLFALRRDGALTVLKSFNQARLDADR
jgi:hypothetical protein